MPLSGFSVNHRLSSWTHVYLSSSFTSSTFLSSLLIHNRIPPSLGIKTQTHIHTYTQTQTTSSSSGDQSSAPVKRKSLLPVTVASCSGGKPGSVVWPEIEEQPPQHSTICDKYCVQLFPP